MKVTPIPAFRDNYIWVLHDEHVAVLVDPGEAAPILAWLQQRQVRPLAILATHHHRDHVGGIEELLRYYPMPVYGPAQEAIPGKSHPLAGGEHLVFQELSLELEVLATPGHTLGHIGFHGEGALFCGDALFSCGCGRVFEGTPEQMHASLSRLGSLPPETRIYCAHEYTLPNIAFAQEVEPDNRALQQRRRQSRELRRAGLPTLPVSLAEEREYNPFLRSDHPDVITAASRYAGRPLPPGAAVFATIRAWKDAE